MSIIDEFMPKPRGYGEVLFLSSGTRSSETSAVDSSSGHLEDDYQGVVLIVDLSALVWAIVAPYPDEVATSEADGEAEWFGLNRLDLLTQ